MMKVKYTLLTLITLILGGGLIAGSARALTETREVDVEFTFDSVLTMSLSSRDLLIDDLVPGGVKNSNEIEITVNTNNASGYKLSATVGDATNNSRDLRHSGGTAAFASIAAGTSLAALATDGTWGYSIDSGASFSGLPIYTDAGAELNSATGATVGVTKFLIGAKAATGQLAGDYSNVINFIAVPAVDSGN